MLKYIIHKYVNKGMDEAAAIQSHEISSLHSPFSRRAKFHHFILEVSSPHSPFSQFLARTLHYHASEGRGRERASEREIQRERERKDERDRETMRERKRERKRE